MNKSLFCRVGDVQCKQFHFFCSDFKHPLLRIIWNVKKNLKKNHFFPLPPAPSPGYPQDPDPDPHPHENFCLDPDPQKKCGSETLAYRIICFANWNQTMLSFQYIFVFSCNVCLNLLHCSLPTTIHTNSRWPWFFSIYFPSHSFSPSLSIK